jgi:hypothetical protein
MIKIALKKIGCALTLCMLMAANPATADADTNDTLKNIYEMRTLTFAILSDYYMFSGLEGDSRYNREIESNVKQFEQHLAKVTDNASPSAKLETLAAALSTWQNYKRLLETNRADFLTQGYANARLVSELSNEGIALNKSLGKVYTSLIEKSAIQLSDLTEKTRNMGLIIQALTAEYAARSTSSLGQVSVIEINEGGMVNQGKNFSTLLQELKTQNANEKRIYKLIDQVEVKWEFIAKSIENYNENAVPFIISSYGDRITQDLVSIESYYSQNLQAKK